MIFSFRRDREIAEVAISTMILRPLVALKETEKLVMDMPFKILARKIITVS